MGNRCPSKKLFDQSGLPHAPPAPHEHTLARLGRAHLCADIVERALQRAEFLVPADKAVHEERSRRGSFIP
jgi:hypothetical protein